MLVSAENGGHTGLLEEVHIDFALVRPDIEILLRLVGFVKEERMMPEYDGNSAFLLASQRFP